MIAYLEGQIIYKASNYIILKTKDGVGYKIFIISNFQFPISNEIPPIRQAQGKNSKSQKNSKEAKEANEAKKLMKLFIYHYIKEDRQDLYGFKTPEELEIFETLISISGVGPKTAFIITSQFSANEIKSAIEKDDVVFFQGVKGLGKKTAGKIILELKGKLVSGKNDLSNPKNSEVIDALVGLGYQKKDLAGVISKVPSKCKTTEEKVKWILKNMK